MNSSEILNTNTTDNWSHKKAELLNGTKPSAWKQEKETHFFAETAPFVPVSNFRHSTRRGEQKRRWRWSMTQQNTYSAQETEWSGNYTQDIFGDILHFKINFKQDL